MSQTDLLTQMRQICLNLPEVRETVKWGHPTFEAGKKMFAVLDHYEGRPCISFRVALEHLATVLTDNRFFEATYAARHGWICLYADQPIPDSELRTFLIDSYRSVP